MGGAVSVAPNKRRAGRCHSAEHLPTSKRSGRTFCFVLRKCVCSQRWNGNKKRRVGGLASKKTARWGGRWLSPIFSDLARLNPTGSTSWCSDTVSTLSTSAWSLEVPCNGVPFAIDDDPLLVRWIANSGSSLGTYSALSTKQLVDIANAADVASLWRSMTIIPLDVGQVSPVQTVVLRKSNTDPRTVQSSVKPAPGQAISIRESPQSIR